MQTLGPYIGKTEFELPLDWALGLVDYAPIFYELLLSVTENLYKFS